MKLLTSLIAAASIVLAWSAPVHAQSASPNHPSTAVRGFADFTFTTFTASESFETIFGSSSGTNFGGGLEVVLKNRFGLSGRFGQISKDGERVFLMGNERFQLGIPVKVKIRPIMLDADYRFPMRRIVPYVGGGVGVYQYEETSSFADTAENVSSSFTAYEVRAGFHAPLTRWFGAGAEFRWTTVPGALGEGGVSKELGEDDLGGINVAIRLTVGK